MIVTIVYPPEMILPEDTKTKTAFKWTTASSSSTDMDEDKQDGEQ